jgi:hypothetical protein
VLHKDVTAVNNPLAADCDAHCGFLLPFGSINPTLPDWREPLRRIQEVDNMVGIRLPPNYHGHALKDAIAGGLPTAGQAGADRADWLNMED